MEPVRITDFLNAVDGHIENINHFPEHIENIGIDSRTVKPGELFWAIRGENHDGHRFVESALEKGACASIVEHLETSRHQTLHRLIRVDNTLDALGRFAKWYRSRYSPIAIGVTGSYGKTTTRELLHRVLSVKQPGIQNNNNYNNEIGVPLTLLKLAREHQFLIMEMGAAKAGEIFPLAEITAPLFGIITGIGPAHLAGFQTLDEIIRTKGELIASLPKTGCALIPGDSEWTRQIIRRANCRVVTFGQQPGNTYRPTRIQSSNSSLRFVVKGRAYQLPISGRHHVSTGLAVIALATELGYSPDQIQQGFSRFQSVSGRGNIRQVSPWTVIDDTYNANPNSCQAACELLAGWETSGKRILVLGDMLELGPDAGDYHETLGRFAAEQQIDVIQAIGEHAGRLVAGVRNTKGSKTSVFAFGEHEELAAELQKTISPGDVVLVKGSRGMQMEQIINILVLDKNPITGADAA